MDIPGLPYIFAGFFAFSFVASSIYIINDYRDREDDRKHPRKSKRPLASGAVKPREAIVMAVLLVLAGVALAYVADHRLRFLLILGAYFLLNVGYSFGLKNIPILDIIIVSMGFSFRVKGGGYISGVTVSPWLNLMVFLLALLMAIAKRRDDILLKMETGLDMRKAVKGYNVDFLNIMLAMVSGIIIMAYIMYCVSPVTVANLGTYHLYYTCIFVVAGLMRYLQITLVSNQAGSPTEILYKDRFIQITMLLWIISFYAFVKWQNTSFFS